MTDSSTASSSDNSGTQANGNDIFQTILDYQACQDAINDMKDSAAGYNAIVTFEEDADASLL
jgi:hypothetical protein